MPWRRKKSFCCKQTVASVHPQIVHALRSQVEHKGKSWLDKSQNSDAAARTSEDELFIGASQLFIGASSDLDTGCCANLPVQLCIAL